MLTATRDGDRLSVSVADNADETDRSASITLNASAEGVETGEDNGPAGGRGSSRTGKAFALGIAREARLRRCGGIGTGSDGNRDGRYHLESIPFGAEEWIHIVPAEGKFTVTVDDNPNALERKASINVSPSDKTVQTGRIYVTQEAAAVPPSIEPYCPTEPPRRRVSNCRSPQGRQICG
mgnify:CR=1 FL=1